MTKSRKTALQDDFADALLESTPLPLGYITDELFYVGYIIDELLDVAEEIDEEGGSEKKKHAAIKKRSDELTQQYYASMSAARPNTLN